MAEGAALEMPCTGNCTVGSNPTPSAILSSAMSDVLMSAKPQTLSVGEKGSVARRRRKAAREAYSPYVERAADSATEADDSASSPDGALAVLDGEVAVPCNPQSAIAGLNSLLEGRLC